MPFDWIPQPQIPEPTPPFTIPSDALTSKQGLVANSVNYGGTISYNTAASAFDIIYEQESLNVLIIQMTTATVDTNAEANASIVNQQYTLNAIANAVANIPAPSGGGGGLRQDFRGLKLSTDPYEDPAVYCSRIRLANADEIIMHDGATANRGWANITANIYTSGANGISSGAVANNTWYEIHAIRNRANGRQGLIFNKADNIYKDGENPFPAVDNTRSEVFRRLTALNGSDNTKFGQSYIPTANGRIDAVTLCMGSSSGGGLAGTYWVTVESDSANTPSGTILATSRIQQARLMGANGTGLCTVRFIFDSPPTVTGGTRYWLVLQGTTTRTNSTITSIRLVGLRPPPSNPAYPGVVLKFDSGSSTWVTPNLLTIIRNAIFKVWMRYDYTPLANTMPTGYDQRCLLGYVYYNQLNFAANRPGLTYFSQVERTRYHSSPTVDGTFITKDANNNFSIIEIDLSPFVPPVPVMCTMQMQQDRTLGFTNLVVWAPVEAINSDVENSVQIGAGGVLSVLYQASASLYSGYAATEFFVERSTILVDSGAAFDKPDTAWVTEVTF